MGDSSIELSPNFLFIVAAPIKTASIIINSKIIPLRIFETNFFLDGTSPNKLNKTKEDISKEKHINKQSIFLNIISPKSTPDVFDIRRSKV